MPTFLHPAEPMSIRNGHSIRVAILKSANILIECGTSLALYCACSISPYPRSIGVFNAIIRIGFGIFPLYFWQRKIQFAQLMNRLCLHHLFEPYNYLHHLIILSIELIVNDPRFLTILRRLRLTDSMAFVV